MFTMREVWEHRSADDCWVAIHGKVYGVSKFLDHHPGGDFIILQAAGKDMTGEFEDWKHSKHAREILKRFCVGKVKMKQTPSCNCATSKRYRAVSSAAIAISAVVTFLYMRKCATSSNY